MMLVLRIRIAVLPIWFAYILLIVIWSTTPLAIKWGLQSVGYMEALVLRMVLGAILISVIVAAIRQHMPWRQGMWKTYCIAGAGMASSMSLVYWGTQYVSSGLLSVIGGTGPIITGVFATFILKDRVFTFMRTLGMILGVLGLICIFHSSVLTQTNQAKGVAAILLSTVFHTFSAVMIKYFHASISPLALATGALWLALPCYMLMWVFIGMPWQPVVETQAIGAIVYLALFGSVIGFVTYYFLIQKISAHNVAMVSLITPAFAMAIGHFANHESWQFTELIGAGLILFGLGIFQLSRS